MNQLFILIPAIAAILAATIILGFFLGGRIESFRGEFLERLGDMNDWLRELDERKVDHANMETCNKAHREELRDLLRKVMENSQDAT